MKGISAPSSLPAIDAAGWDIQDQEREKVSFTAGRIIVRGRLYTRGKNRRAGYVLIIFAFKKATELFADPDFDGDPGRSMKISVNLWRSAISLKLASTKAQQSAAMADETLLEDQVMKGIATAGVEYRH